MMMELGGNEVNRAKSDPERDNRKESNPQSINWGSVPTLDQEPADVLHDSQVILYI